MGETCEEGKCECCSNEGSQCCSCESDCCERGYDKIDMFMYLVHSAKMELVKEKMKKRLEAAKGKQLDQVADLFVNAMMDKYKDEAESERKREELRQKFENIFNKE